MIQKFTVSWDDSIYEAFPDVTLTADGLLLCVFAECTIHGKRDWTRLVLTESADRGRTWSPKRPPTEPTKGNLYWNCARVTTLRDVAWPSSPITSGPTSLIRIITCLKKLSLSQHQPRPHLVCTPPAAGAGQRGRPVN